LGGGKAPGVFEFKGITLKERLAKAMLHLASSTQPDHDRCIEWFVGLIDSGDASSCVFDATGP